jgi:hypothetical protein
MISPSTVILNIRCPTSTIGRDEEVIRNYIRRQEVDEDIY